VHLLHVNRGSRFDFASQPVVEFDDAFDFRFVVSRFLSLYWAGWSEEQVADEEEEEEEGREEAHHGALAGTPGGKEVDETLNAEPFSKALRAFFRRRIFRRRVTFQRRGLRRF